jgi:pimeloyl-ACP methyl ester carboxylesterase
MTGSTSAAKRPDPGWQISSRSWKPAGAWSCRYASTWARCCPGWPTSPSNALANSRPGPGRIASNYPLGVPVNRVDSHTLTEAKAIFGKTYAVPDELWLEVFFSPTETSQAAGQAFLQRLRARKENRDPPISEKVAPVQIAALEGWGAPRNEPYAYLKNIKQSVLIIHGSNDVIIYTVNSFILQQNLPNAQLILYPDSNHGSQYQFPELFVEHVTLFLGEPSIGRSRETLGQAPQEARHWVEFVGAV